MMIFRKFIDRLRSIGCYVIADAQDNSITLSRLLCKRMGVMRLDDKAKVFVFRLNDTKRQYAFTLNPSLDQPTQLADIQYNSKYRCIGFECLVPTVNRIFFDYGIAPDIRVKLSVSVAHIQSNGMEYFIIRRPNRKTL